MGSDPSDSPAKISRLSSHLPLHHITSKKNLKKFSKFFQKKKDFFKSV